MAANNYKCQLSASLLATLHCGKFRWTRRTFTLVAKISTFVEILGVFDQVVRVLDVYFTQFSLRKASWAIRKYYVEKSSRQHAVSVRLGFYSALGDMQDGPSGS